MQIDNHFRCLGQHPANPFTEPIQALLITYPDPVYTLWALMGAFFAAVVTSSTSHDPHLALLDALRVQSITHPDNVSSTYDAERGLRTYIQADGNLHWQALPRFGLQ
jgi:hypothetical protein